VKIGSYLRVGFNTTLNIILYAATTGRYLWLEGRVRHGVDICDLQEVRRSLDTLVATNDHFSLYLFPFTDQCQVNTWNHTDRPDSWGADIREFCNISLDALLAAWMGNLLAYTKLPPLSERWSRLSYLVRRGSNLVESDCAYSRTIYHPPRTRVHGPVRGNIQRL
jgi:hypothetical protein